MCQTDGFSAQRNLLVPVLFASHLSSPGCCDRFHDMALYSHGWDDVVRKQETTLATLSQAHMFPPMRFPPLPVRLTWSRGSYVRSNNGRIQSLGTRPA